MKMKNLLFLFTLTLFSFTAFSQVKFEAKVSKERLGINERLGVEFEMEEDGYNFRRPSFDEFSIVGGPNLSNSNTCVNGKRSISKTYSFFLSPLKRGIITIGQTTVEID